MQKKLSVKLSIICIFCLFFAVSEQAHAKNINLAIAVTPLKPINCGASVANKATDDLREYLQKSLIYKVISKEKTIEALRQISNAGKYCQEIYCIEALAKKINAEKILSGTIAWVPDRRAKNSEGTFVIKCTIVIVKPWEFEERYYQVDSKREPEITEAIEKIVVSLQKYDREKLNFSITVRGGASFPVGRFSRVAAISGGPECSFDIYPFTIAQRVPLGIDLTTGFTFFNGNDHAVDYIQMIPLTAGLFFPFHIYNAFSIKPQISAGLMISRMRHDITDSSGGPTRRGLDTYYDAMMGVSAGFQYRVLRYLCLELVPSVNLIFTNNGPDVTIGLYAGLGFIF